MEGLVTVSTKQSTIRAQGVIRRPLGEAGSPRWMPPGDSQAVTCLL